ncbi:MAG: type II secretion system GspH family protein [Chitinispirillales bacterium]|nr:type II secretion system GspH family protein [Chitinispirillales bacterium]
MRKNGFTLVELMIVVVVIGVLASFAMPKFQRAADKIKAAEAPQTLNAIVGGEESYRIVNGRYLELTSDGSPADSANWAKIGLKVPDSKYFKYTVGDISHTPPIDETDPLDMGTLKFTAKATLIRSLTTAKIDETITVNQSGDKNASSEELRLLVPSYVDKK